MRTRLVGATPFKEEGRGLAMEELDAGQCPDDPIAEEAVHELQKQRPLAETSGQRQQF
jgi:hypothetical protein